MIFRLVLSIIVLIFAVAQSAHASESVDERQILCMELRQSYLQVLNSRRFSSGGRRKVLFKISNIFPPYVSRIFNY